MSYITGLLKFQEVDITSIKRGNIRKARKLSANTTIILELDMTERTKGFGKLSVYEYGSDKELIFRYKDETIEMHEKWCLRLSIDGIRTNGQS